MESGRHQKGGLRFGIIALLALFLFSVVSPIYINSASAAASYAAMNPEEKAKSYVLYYAILKCFEGINSISNADIISGEVGGTGDIPSWYLDKTIGNASDGKIKCTTAEKAAIALWDYGTLDDMLTAFGYVNPGDGGDWENSNPGTDIAQELKTNVFDGVNPSMGLAERYIYFKGTLEAACEIASPVDYASAPSSLKAEVDGGGTKYVKLTEPKPDYTGTVDMIYTVGSWKTLTYALFPDNTPFPPNDNSINCRELAAYASSGAEAYTAWAVDHADDAKLIDGGGAGGTAPKPTTTCSPEIGGVGWIVCPVINFLSKINDGMFDFIASHFLRTNPELFNTDNGTYIAWGVFRNYANIAFVIAFMFIIYSQVTSAGIKNYGIKRMLPRLIIAAILVNISYFICQAAIDLSNVIGFSLQNLLHGIPATTTGEGEVPKFLEVTGLILAGGAAIAGAIALLLALSSAVVVAALIALGIIVLILVVREAAIVMLVVLSPLAFVAYLLPNTESWFKKWYKMFIALLMIFPVIAVVFGASDLAARIINAAAGSAGGADTVVLQLTSMGMAAIPLFVVPGMLVGSVAAIGSIGGKLQSMGGRGTGKISSKVKDSSYAGAYLSQRKKIKTAARAQGHGTGVIRGRLSKSRLTGRAGTELAATGSALASREEKEAVDNEIIRMQKQDGWTESKRLDLAQAEYVKAMKSDDSTKARAAQAILLNGGNKGISQLESAMVQLESDSEYTAIMETATGQKAMSDINSAGIKTKNAALTKLAYSKAGTKVSDLSNDARTYTDLNDAELSGQSVQNIRNAIKSGGISAVRANEMMSNQNVWSQLSEDKKALIRTAAAGSPLPPPGAVPPPAGGGNPQPPPNPPAGGMPGQPNPNPNPAPNSPPQSPPAQPFGPPRPPRPTPPPRPGTPPQQPTPTPGPTPGPTQAPSAPPQPTPSNPTPPSTPPNNSNGGFIK